MQTMKFSHLWDKLNDAEFTTIRSWDQGKEDYYQKLERTEFQVWKAFDKYPFRQERVLFHAWLYKVTVVTPAALSENVILKDIKLNGAVQEIWRAKILKMDKALLLEFAKRPKPVQLNLEEVPK